VCWRVTRWVRVALAWCTCMAEVSIRYKTICSREIILSWAQIAAVDCFQCRIATVLFDVSNYKYLQDLCVPVSTTASRRHLRSAARGDLQVLATKTVTFRPRSFASSAPKLWNSLPLPLRDLTLTLRQFGSRLKTHLFSLAYGRTSWRLRL